VTNLPHNFSTLRQNLLRRGEKLHSCSLDVSRQRLSIRKLCRDVCANPHSLGKSKKSRGLHRIIPQSARPSASFKPRRARILVCSNRNPTARSESAGARASSVSVACPSDTGEFLAQTRLLSAGLRALGPFKESPGSEQPCSQEIFVE